LWGGIDGCGHKNSLFAHDLSYKFYGAKNNDRNDMQSQAEN